MIRLLWSAWEPVTPRGVAAFARAPLRRLWVVQFVVACIAAAATAWLLNRAVFPTVTTAMEKLPETGVVRSARLDWNGESAVRLAEGRFLSISVDLNHSGNVRSPAHLQLEFGRDDVLACSLLGCVTFVYPSGWTIAFNRTEALPWWGAWEMPLLGLIAVMVVLWLLVCWQLLASLYVLPVWLAGFFANRRLSLAGSWKLSGAAQMPGALLMSLAIVLYTQGWLDLLPMACVFIGHLVLAWIYLFIGPWFVPRLADVRAGKNPFAK